LNRPINAAVFYASQRAVFNYIEKTYNIPFNIVPFKTPAQFYPTLVDGSIDIAMDTGGGLELATAGKFKIAGYFSRHEYEKIKGHPNFFRDSPNMFITQWLGIAVPNGMDPAVKATVTQRLKEVAQSARIQKMANDNLSVVDFTTQPQLNSVIDMQRQRLERNWK
jgi:tripartite-type tricarboxylate transporter receptor subunit TctC